MLWWLSYLLTTWLPSLIDVCLSIVDNILQNRVFWGKRIQETLADERVGDLKNACAQGVCYLQDSEVAWADFSSNLYQCLTRTFTRIGLRTHRPGHHPWELACFDLGWVQIRSNIVGFTRPPTIAGTSSCVHTEATYGMVPFETSKLAHPITTHIHSVVITCLASWSVLLIMKGDPDSTAYPIQTSFHHKPALLDPHSLYRMFLLLLSQNENMAFPLIYHFHCVPSNAENHRIAGCCQFSAFSTKQHL